MQIVFSTALDMDTHQGIFNSLWSVGIIGSVLSIFARSQHVMVDSW